MEGAVKLGDEELALLRVTLSPPVCVHEYETMVPSESDDPLPSSVTEAPAATLRLLPAFALGGMFGTAEEVDLSGDVDLSETKTSTVSVPEALSSSITVKVKVKV